MSEKNITIDLGLPWVAFWIAIGMSTYGNNPVIDTFVEPLEKGFEKFVEKIR